MKPPIRVLFICTANACRSQMAEAVLRHLGGLRFEARSAGVSPIDAVHPLALGALAAHDIPIEGQYPKSFEELLAVEHDIVLTLCDSVACMDPPRWLGDPVSAHWSLPDPVIYPGTPEEKAELARFVVGELIDWVGQLIALPLEKMSRAALRDRLYKIAAI